MNLKAGDIVRIVQFYKDSQKVKYEFHALIESVVDPGNHYIYRTFISYTGGVTLADTKHDLYNKKNVKVVALCSVGGS